MERIKTTISLFLLFSVLIFAQPEWELLNSGTNKELRDIHFVSSDIGFVVGYSGVILKTTNHGNTWTEQNSGTLVDLMSIYFIDEQKGWIGGKNGLILKTTNGGINWSPIQTVFTNELIYSIDFIDENIGLAAVGQVTSTYYNGRIIKTTDGGNSWQIKYSIFDDAYFDIVMNGEYGWVVGTGVAAYSTNYGEVWYPVYPATEQWLFSTYFLDRTTGWAVGGQVPAQIVKTTTGGITWFIQKEFYLNKRFKGVYFNDLNDGWIVGEQGLILNTTDGGNNWNFQSTPTSNELIAIKFSTPDVGFIVGKGGVILRYSEIFDFINVITPNGGEILTADSTYFIEWNSHDVVDVKLEYSTDNGTNWISIIDSTPSTGIFLWTVPNIITEEGRIKITDINDPNIYDISDANFTIQSSKTISVYSPNGGEIIEGGSQFEILWSSNDVEDVKLEYTINNGASWYIIIDSTQSTGVFLWTVPNILTIQARVKISDIEMPAIYDISDEVFRIEYINDVSDNDIITKYVLEQNYPNPFNPNTGIKYSIPQISKVVLIVFDVLGNEVATLVNEEKPSGNYHVEFDANELPSGIYFYRLKSGSFVETKKMILMK